MLGVALVVPSERYLSLLAEGGLATTPSLSAETWREIDAWAADGDARLPARPAPMSASTVAALLGGEQSSAVCVQRFASIPITAASHGDLAQLADSLLPDLMNARRSAP